MSGVQAFVKHPSTKQRAGHTKRIVYGCIGVGLIALGLLRRAAGDAEFPVWGRLLILGGGLFFLYVASMYYLPKNRHKRAALEELLN